MKTPKKSGCMTWLVIIGGVLLLSVIYGIFIEPFTNKNQKTAEVISANVATDQPAITSVETAPTETAKTPEPVITSAPTPAPTASPLPKIRKGDKGAAVRYAQERLIALGYLSGSADGDYGKKTQQAVMDFQLCNGLKEDGVIGSDTWDRLTNNLWAKSNDYVYVSKAGVYHTDEHCSGMKTSTKMRLADAVRAGYKSHHCH